MRTLTKLAFTLVLTVAASVEIVAQQNTDLAGSYVISSEFGGAEIILKNNGTFSALSSSCTDATTEYGPFIVSNNSIRFTTRKLTRRSFSDNKEHDLTKRKARKKYLDTDEPFRPHSWELQILRWGERIYLLEPRLFSSLIAVINIGLEPRSVESYRAYYGYIYLRVGDEKKPVTGPPPLPEEFLRDLLPAPVIATVLELKTEGSMTLATIDRGSAHGLKKDMLLVSSIPTIFFQPYPINSVTEHSAQVYVWGDVKVGDQLSTRLPDVRSLALSTTNNSVSLVEQ